jgi:hypothetical protein
MIARVEIFPNMDTSKFVSVVQKTDNENQHIQRFTDLVQVLVRDLDASRVDIWNAVAKNIRYDAGHYNVSIRLRIRNAIDPTFPNTIIVNGLTTTRGIQDNQGGVTLIKETNASVTFNFTVEHTADED